MAVPRVNSWFSMDKSLCSRGLVLVCLGVFVRKQSGRAALLRLKVEVLLFRDGVIDLNE